MIEKALYAILHDDPKIKRRVGDRIFPLERDQGSKLPALTYQRVKGVRDSDMEGVTGLVESRFLISIYAERRGNKSAYLGAKELRSLIRDRLCPQGGFREVVGSTEIQGIFVNDEDDRRTDGATGVGVVRVILDCTIWHIEHFL